MPERTEKHSRFYNLLTFLWSIEIPLLHREVNNRLGRLNGVGSRQKREGSLKAPSGLTDGIRNARGLGFSGH